MANRAAATVAVTDVAAFVIAATTAAKRAAFRKLHEGGCFVLPNPWDVGSARLLQQLGFKALASTSSGFAWSTGRADNHVTCDDVLAHLTQLSAAVDLPINADFESGFADDPEGVAANVTRAVATGIAAGCSRLASLSRARAITVWGTPASWATCTTGRRASSGGA